MIFCCRLIGFHPRLSCWLGQPLHRKKKVEKRGKGGRAIVSVSRDGGSPNKTTAKVRGHLLIYFLYASEHFLFLFSVTIPPLPGGCYMSLLASWAICRNNKPNEGPCSCLSFSLNNCSSHCCQLFICLAS